MMIKLYDVAHIEIYTTKGNLAEDDTFWYMFFDAIYVDIQSGLDEFVRLLDYYDYITDGITENGMYKFNTDYSAWERVYNFVQYRPMVHAYWDWRNSYMFKCSNCKKIGHSISDRFCPNCGAQMNESEDDKHE